MHTEVFETKNGAIDAESDSDDEEMDDIDEVPINPLPQNRQGSPVSQAATNNEDQQIKVTRGLLFARKLQ